MPKTKKGRDLKNWRSPKTAADPGKLRIIGGKYRGRQIEYSGDPITRPMKDDIREAIFNLVGGWTSDKIVFDLFAGTGAVGLEAISRGAQYAYLIERHFPTAKIIKSNIKVLGDDLPVTVASSDSFFWSRKFLKNESLPTDPWLVFCCPPYDLYVRKPDEVLDLIRSYVEFSPDESLIVVESDSRFDPHKLPKGEHGQHVWVSRQYTPAVVSILKKNFPELVDQSE